MSNINYKELAESVLTSDEGVDLNYIELITLQRLLATYKGYLDLLNKEGFVSDSTHREDSADIDKIVSKLKKQSSIFR